MPHQSNSDGEQSHLANGGRLSKIPPQLSGAFATVTSRLVTPMVGTEFPDANIAEWLRAPNSDELIRDLAITGTNYGLL